MKSIVALAFLAAAAVAQEKEAAGALSVETILVKPEELPKNVRLVDGIQAKAPHAGAFFETPDGDGAARLLPPESRTSFSKGHFDGFPVPKRKEYQSFEAAGGAKGTVFVFEYETRDLGGVRSALKPILWRRKRPTDAHPEEIIIKDRVLWVITFPRGDPAAEWYKERLRKKFRVPAPRTRLELVALEAKIADAFDAEDADTGLRLLRENAKAVDQWAFGYCTLGWFAEMKGDLALAESGYRKALELHENLTDPLEPGFLWSATDGLGLSLDGQGKLEEAAKVFDRAIAAAAAAGEEESVTHSKYNLAGVHAKMKNYDAALRLLTESIEAEAEVKEIARTDPDFAEARKRPEFQELLK